MSLKRVVLLATAAVLILPATAFADGIDIGFNTGTLTSTTGGALTTVPTGAATLNWLSRYPGGPGFPVTGSVSMTTGVAMGSPPSTPTATYFAAGGSFTATLGAALVSGSNSIPSGTTIFTGTFVDWTTVPQFFLASFPALPAGASGVLMSIACPPSLAATNPGAVCWRFVGALSGTINPAVASFFGLGSTPITANGWVADLTLSVGTSGVIQIVSGDAAVVVPEPATLALFGTGLLGIAGLVRRKLPA